MAAELLRGSRCCPRSPASFRADYDLTAFRSDLLAGVTVAVVALPLALRFGITPGAGAAAGLYTAMAAGILGAPKGESEQVAVASWQILRAFADAPDMATPTPGLLTVGTMVGWVRMERLRAYPASMAALLAAILMVVAARMVEIAEFREILRATKPDAATMLLTLGVTVAFDLILAIEVGLIVVGALFVPRMFQLFQVDPTALGGDVPPVRESRAADNAERELRRDDLVAYRIEGPNVFGAADRFFEVLLRVDHNIRIVVQRIRRVPVMDVTGAAALRALVDQITRRGIVVMMSGVQDQPRSVLERTGILAEVTRKGDHLFDDTDPAISHGLKRPGLSAALMWVAALG